VKFRKFVFAGKPAASQQDLILKDGLANGGIGGLGKVAGR